MRTPFSVFVRPRSVDSMLKDWGFGDESVKALSTLPMGDFSGQTTATATLRALGELTSTEQPISLSFSNCSYSWYVLCSGCPQADHSPPPAPFHCPPRNSGSSLSRPAPAA